MIARQLVLFHFSAEVPVAKELKELRLRPRQEKPSWAAETFQRQDVKSFDPSLSCLQPGFPLPCLLQPAVVPQPRTAGPRLSAAGKPTGELLVPQARVVSHFFRSFVVIDIQNNLLNCLSRPSSGKDGVIRLTASREPASSFA